MAVKIERKHHKIDAAGKAPGRLASEIVKLLRGKQKPSFTDNIDNGDFVEVKNVSQIKFTGKKMEQKVYRHHSLYQGGLKEIPLKRLFKEQPEEVLRKAVWNMLPKNKLRNAMIKRLTVK